MYATIPKAFYLWSRTVIYTSPRGQAANAASPKIKVKPLPNPMWQSACAATAKNQIKPLPNPS